MNIDSISIHHYQVAASSSHLLFHPKFILALEVELAESIRIVRAW